MIQLTPVGILLLGLLPWGSTALGRSPSPDASVLARVNGESVTTADLEVLLAGQQRPDGDPGKASHLSPEGVLKRLIQNRLLEQEGYGIGTHETPKVKSQVWDLVRYRSMIALMDSISAEVPEPNPEDFDSILSRRNTMHRLSHVLVDDESSARDLLDSLAAGIPFADLAARHSRDTTWAGDGGDLGWAREDAYILEFQEAIQGIGKGDVAGPVKTERGWHILMLMDTRTETVGQSDRMSTALQEAAMRDRVMKTLRSYVMSLREKYDVVVNESLLASLDYTSEDTEVQTELRDSDAVLATLPWRNLTVSGLTRNIRFEHFHGLRGKPDAAEIRNRLFDDWLTESLLRHEASVLGFNKKPGIVAQADRLERRLIREAVIEMILAIRFDPSQEETEAFYADHIGEFTPNPRIRAEGVFLESEEASRRFREGLESGARLSWLAARTPEVSDPSPAVFSDWLDAELLGVSGVERGKILGPMEIEGSWAVAKVLEMKSAGPTPLDQCRSQVLGKMKSEQMRKAMGEAMATLESQAEIEVLDGAHREIERRVNAWLGTSTMSENP
jgi:hypothetical protein